MSSNSMGLIWAIAAAALYSVALAMVKFAVVDFHVLQILFIRQVVVFISTLPVLASTFPNSMKTKRPIVHAVRLAGAFLALSGGIWAVALLPLTTATALAFSQVFFVAVLASGFLGEKIGIHRIFAILGGIIGVAIITRPSLGGFLAVEALVPVAGAFGAAIAIICVRTLSQTDSKATLLSYQSVFIGLFSGVPLLWLWVTPTLPQLAFLLSIGVIATIAQWAGIEALRLGEASLVGNIEYTKLIYAVLLGHWMFSEFPDIEILTGTAIIICSSTYLFHRNTRNAKQIS